MLYFISGYSHNPVLRFFFTLFLSVYEKIGFGLGDLTCVLCGTQMYSSLILIIGSMYNNNNNNNDSYMNMNNKNPIHSMPQWQYNNNDNIKLWNDVL